MAKILAKKLKMSQIWKNDKVVPVTILKAMGSEEELKNLQEFKEGDYVRVSGKSKGKGFQGVVKRHGFHGGPKTHGQKNRMRAPGSIGATAPQRVIKGKKMAGHMGFERVTVKNLELVQIKQEDQMLMIKGAVPGMRGTVVEIKK
ncbi:MAG: 50S ribosomal protein L3 [Patescibacteria group bacterium]|nr:50S ribosomal protein L3 [Patescibacteria group bacterium]